MIWYKLVAGLYGDKPNTVESSSGWFIPFDSANTDYQTFKIQVADGTPLEDPEGNVMSQEQVDDFLKTIP